LTLLPAREWLAAQPEVQGPAPGQLDVMLDIKSRECVAIVLECPEALLECPGPTQEEIRHGIAAVVAGEGKQPRLPEEVPDQDLAELNVSAEMEGMSSHDPACVVVEGIVVADE